jgi:hypothetical protein
VTNTTSIDGLTVKIGHGTSSSFQSGISCAGSPTIKNCLVYGRASTDTPGGYVYGIFLGSGSAAMISDNTIKNISCTSRSFGIYTNLASATINSNTINGGTGGTYSYGIYCNGASTIPDIEFNTIDGGVGSGSGASITGAFCVYISGATPTINGNIFSFSANLGNTWGVYGTASPAVTACTNNHFHFSPNSQGYYYYDGTAMINTTGGFDSISITIQGGSTNTLTGFINSHL